MCCIIHRMKGSRKISDDNLKKVIKKNPDGWGIAYLDDDGIIQVEKSMDMTLAFDKVKEIESQDREFLFHARWATHGEKNTQNCHPYDIHDGVMFHNGKMELNGWKKHMSDTWHLSQKITKFLRKNQPLDHLILKKYKDLINESRLAFMFNDGSIVKYGKWHEIDDCFYSKLDWQNAWINTGYFNINRITRPVNNYPYSDTLINNSSSDRKVKIIKKTETEKLPYEKLVEINELAKMGEITDEHIDLLDVQEIQTLCETYPTNMAKYLYELIHRTEEEN